MYRLFLKAGITVFRVESKRPTHIWSPCGGRCAVAASGAFFEWGSPCGAGLPQGIGMGLRKAENVDAAGRRVSPPRGRISNTLEREILLCLKFVI